MTQAQENQKEAIIAALKKNHVENIDGLQTEIEHIVSLVSELGSHAQNNSNNDFLSQLEGSFVVLFSKIGQQYGNVQDKKSKISDISADICDVLGSHPKFNNIKLKANSARDAVSLYDKVAIAFKKSTGQNDIIELAHNIVDLSLKISSMHDVTYPIRSSTAMKALKTSCESFFKNFDLPAAALDFAQSLEKTMEVNITAHKVIKGAADERVHEIQDSIEKEEAGLSFKENGALDGYLKSADAKTLAANLDRNMRDQHVVLDKDFVLHIKVKKLFSPNMVKKMQEIGQEIEERRKERGTFVGKVRQKVEDYSAIVIEAFSKLFGKKLDDPKLEAAVSECNLKIKAIDKHLAAEQTTPRRVSSFINQVLEAQSTKSQSGQRRE